MRKSKFTEEQIIKVLKEVEAGAKVQEVMRRVGAVAITSRALAGAFFATVSLLEQREHLIEVDLWEPDRVAEGGIALGITINTLAASPSVQFASASPANLERFGVP